MGSGVRRAVPARLRLLHLDGAAAEEELFPLIGHGAPRVHGAGRARLAVSFLILALASCQSRPCTTIEDAFEQVVALPEVVELSYRVPERSGGEADVLLMKDGEDADNWVVYVGENFPDHTVRIYTFQVRKRSGEILVWDVVQGEELALESWRKFGYR